VTNWSCDELTGSSAKSFQLNYYDIRTSQLVTDNTLYHVL